MIQKFLINSPALPKEIFQILLSIIDEAILEITERKISDDLIVFNLRKRVKNLRALLKLLRKEFGEEFYKKNNFSLRDVNRRSTAIRNFSALIKVCEILKSASSDPICNEALNLLQSRIESDFEDVKRKTDYDALLNFYKNQLGKYKTRLLHNEIDSNRFSNIKYGLYKIYSDGKKNFAMVINNPESEVLHDWRKNAKDLYYSLLSLTPLWKPVILGYTKEIKLLSDMLGELHDLYEFKLYIQSLIDNPFDFTSVIYFIESQNSSLLEESGSLGKKIYAEDEEQFSERIKKYYTGYKREFKK
ncbi:MAG: CHAD domain-containing protein [Ignavibacteriaceae bacterium]